MAVPSDPKNTLASRVLLVLGQTPFPVELLDQEFRVLYCNVAYTNTFLDEAAQVLDRPSRVFPQVLTDGMSRGELLNKLSADGLWKGEVVVQTVHHHPLPVRLCVFPVSDVGGSEEFAVFYEDISHEVEARETLIHQQNLVAIRSRQAQMGELLSMIAHQWRQPLTVVMSLIGNIQLKARMGTSVDPSYLNDKLERAGQTIQFLSETIDAFRNFHAPSRHKTSEDLAGLTRKAYDLVAPSMAKVGIHLEFVAPEPVPVRIFGGEVQQLVLELMNNGRDVLVDSGRGESVLRLSVLREGSHAVVRVGNNGQCIPPDVLPKIFDPYYSTKDASSGSGLGLYMAKTIVEKHHGGSLTVDSRPGWTEFVATFPGEAV